jgi:hypothetical protein
METNHVGTDAPVCPGRAKARHDFFLQRFDGIKIEKTAGPCRAGQTGRPSLRVPQKMKLREQPRLAQFLPELRM